MCYDGTEGFVWATTCQIVIVLLTFIIWTLRAAIYEADAPPPEKVVGPYTPPNPSCCCGNGNGNSRQLETNGIADEDYMDRTNTASNTKNTNNNNNKFKIEAELEARVVEDEERLLERNIPRSSSGE